MNLQQAKQEIEKLDAGSFAYNGQYKIAVEALGFTLVGYAMRGNEYVDVSELPDDDNWTIAV